MKLYQFKAKDSDRNPNALYLGNISKDFTADDMKKAGLNGCVYGFSVDYSTTDVNNIVHIYKYLMKKT